MAQISLSTIFSWRILSNYNKDVVLTITGERGSGKSISALYLAWKTAQAISLKETKEPDNWQQYFNLDENLSVIDPNSLLEKMQHLKPKNIFLMDDCGTGFSSREFMSSRNRTLGKILQVCRSAGAGLFFTVPDLSFLDVQARNMMSFYVEIAESHHDKGYNLAKCFKVTRLQRNQKTLFSHLTFHTKNGGNSKIVRWAFYKPPNDMIEKYNIIRAENAKIMMEQQHIENKTIDSKVAQKWDTINEKWAKTVEEMHRNKDSVLKIRKCTGLTEYAVKKIIINHEMLEHNPKESISCP